MSLKFSIDFTRPTLKEAMISGTPEPQFKRASTANYHDVDGVLQSAAIDVPRVRAFNWNDTNGAWECEGLLTEGEKTNTCLYSEDLSNAAWVKTATTITANTAVFVDNATVMDTVDHTGGTGNVHQDITITALREYTFSAYVEAVGSHDWVRISFVDASTPTNGVEAYFNISGNGAAGAAQAIGSGAVLLASGFRDIGGAGKFRIWVSGTLPSGQTDGRVEIRNVTADDTTTPEETETVYWCGFQLEDPGVEPTKDAENYTSYIKTVASSVTRIDDDLFHKTVLDVIDLELSAQGQWVFEGMNDETEPGVGGTNWLIWINDGATSYIQSKQLEASDTFEVSGVSGGGTKETTDTYTVGTPFSIAFEYQNGELNIALDNQTMVQDTTSVVYPLATAFHDISFFTYVTAGTNNWFGFIRNIRSWDTFNDIDIESVAAYHAAPVYDQKAFQFRSDNGALTEPV